MHKFLDPDSVAIIGVPRLAGPGSFNNVEVMIRYGYGGRIYPINPNAADICGLKSYASVESLPEVPDLAVISVGRERVAVALRACGDFGIRRAIIITQGFADADSQGARMQEELLQIAAARGMRVIGPNTMGVANNYRRFTSAFIDLAFPKIFAPVSVVAQTGFMQVAVEEFFPGNLGKAIDIGNGSDVDHLDALRYLAEDTETKVIVAHIEGLKRGREFLELAGQVTREKPVIVVKTGRSSAGAKAAISHTGSLVGEDEVADCAFRRAGIIRVHTADELQDAIHASLLLAEMKGPRLGIVTITGAGGIMAVDQAEKHGIVLAEMPEGLPAKLTSGLPQWLHAGNPLDIWPIGMIGGRYREAVHDALCGFLGSPHIDGVLFIVPISDSPLHGNLDTVPVVQRVRQEHTDKPLVVWPYIDPTAPARFEEIENTACFKSIERSVDGLGYCYKRYLARTRTAPVQRDFAVDEARCAALLEKGKSEKALVGTEALDLLAAFGIPVAASRFAKSLTELEALAGRMGYPLVLKVSGKDFLHKTEIGGVITSIANKAGLRKAYKQLKSRARAAKPQSKFGFVLQEQAAGREVLVGLKNDPQFGPVLACGAGGIYTEVLRDVSREMVPVDADTARGMLQALKIYPLLKGTRGEAGVDLEILRDILERVSCLAARAPGISELDLNPVMASPEGCVAVDARIIFE